jgi:hypothetical protein
MKNDGSYEITSGQHPSSTPGRLPDILRIVALIAAVAGAVGSVALTLRAGKSSPRLLLVLFVLWVLSPFAALAWANIVSIRWADLTRTTLCGVTLIITLGSLAIYSGFVSPPAGSAHAFVFVVVPLVRG